MMQKKKKSYSLQYAVLYAVGNQHSPNTHTHTYANELLHSTGAQAAIL